MRSGERPSRSGSSSEASSRASSRAPTSSFAKLSRARIKLQPQQARRKQPEKPAKCKLGKLTRSEQKARIRRPASLLPERVLEYPGLFSHLRVKGEFPSKSSVRKDTQPWTQLQEGEVFASHFIPFNQIEVGWAAGVVLSWYLSTSSLFSLSKAGFPQTKPNQIKSKKQVKEKVKDF